MQKEQPCSVVLIEKNKQQLFKGAAYSSVLRHQLLNVPILGMSLLADRIDHFWLWVQSQDLPVKYDPHDFVPRDLFGRYITDTIREALEETKHSFETLTASVEDVQQTDTGYILFTSGGQAISADAVVLCSGNLPSQDLTGLTQSARSHMRYVQNPWRGTYVDNVGTEDSVLITGTGLTMVDQVLSLVKSGHKGKIFLLSRRGFLPESHGPAPEYTLQYIATADTSTVIGTLQWIRREIKAATTMGANWISVLNAIRDLTPTIWAEWTRTERARFLRHLKPHWEVHRHRIPAESYTTIQALMREGRIEKLAGRIQVIDASMQKFATSFVVREDKSCKTLSTDWVINCTGPHANIRRTEVPLIHNLIRRNIVLPDPLALGLMPTAQSPQFHIIGPPAKGTYWECTALREIRKHAAHTANEIVNYRRTQTKQLVATAEKALAL
jgi:uncharacterized NAD(P)/FAD-binding protein YdhS